MFSIDVAIIGYILIIIIIIIIIIIVIVIVIGIAVDLDIIFNPSLLSGIRWNFFLCIYLGSIIVVVSWDVDIIVVVCICSVCIASLQLGRLSKSVLE